MRRIEALTGPGAFAHLRAQEHALARVADLVKAPVSGVERRVQQLLHERRSLEKKVDEAMRGGGDELDRLLEAAHPMGDNGARLVFGEVSVSDVKALQAMSDTLRAQLGSGVGILAATLEDGKGSIVAVVTDDQRDRGLRADAIVRELAASVGGRGGGKPHMAQAGIPDAARLGEALARAPQVVAALAARA